MSTSDKFGFGKKESRLRMQTIIRLRWFGVGGQLITVIGVYWGLGYSLPVGQCLAWIACSAWVNVFLRVRYPARHRLSTNFATTVLAYDILELSALLYLTGGIENPFAFLVVAPVTVSAATLPQRNTIVLGLLALAAAVGLVEYHWPLPWVAQQTFALPTLYKLGMLASIAAGMIFLVLYAARLSKEARQMSAALSATEHVLAREQKLHALDGLAAAAAHELGTPLATISLVTKELERETAGMPAIRDDIALLRTQADRCREILRKLTRHPTERDPHHVALPVSQLLDEASAPYRMLASRIDISAAPAVNPARAAGQNSQSGTSSVAGSAAMLREPIGERRPGVIYGLGNIIENAADFARERVEICARWDERDLIVTIADDGPGFAPEIIDTLGDPYVTTRAAGQRSAVTGKEASGLGLGFFIAKTLLERSGAKLAFTNRELPLTGAMVKVTWPRQAFDLPDADAQIAAVPIRQAAE